MSKTPVTATVPDQDLASVPVSRRIRERIHAARERFHANDNIARFIEPEELPLLLDCLRTNLSVQASRRGWSPLTSSAGWS